MIDTSIVFGGLLLSLLPSCSSTHSFVRRLANSTTHHSYLCSSDTAAVKNVFLKERYELCGMTKTNEFGLVSQFYSEHYILHLISDTESMDYDIRKLTQVLWRMNITFQGFKVGTSERLPIFDRFRYSSNTSSPLCFGRKAFLWLNQCAFHFYKIWHCSLEIIGNDRDQLRFIDE